MKSKIQSVYLNRLSFSMLLANFDHKVYLKVQPCKLYNNKYMIVSTRITNTEIFAFIVVLVFKLLSHKVLFTQTELTIETVKK